MRRALFSLLLTCLLMATGVGLATAQTIFETYEEGAVSFDWSGWPFGTPSGSVSVDGPVWNEDLTFPEGDQGCGGGISGVEADSTQAVAIGGIDNGDGTYDAVAVFVTFPTGPAVGSYPVDAANNTVGFVYIDNVSNLTIPGQDDDLREWFNNLEATGRYGSTSGTIVVTAVSTDGFEGSFSGLMADPETYQLRNVDNGLFSVQNVALAPVPQPTAPARLHAAPNPFNPQTTIELSLERPERVVVAVYDLAGHRVAWLHRGRLDAGDHTWVWDGRSDAGVRQGAGMYLCRAAGPGWSRGAKLVLVP